MWGIGLAEGPSHLSVPKLKTASYTEKIGYYLPVRDFDYFLREE